MTDPAKAIVECAEWVWQTSVGAAMIVCVVAALQWTMGRLLTPRARLALWWLVVVRLLLPAVPSSSFSAWHLAPDTMRRDAQEIPAAVVSPGSALPQALPHAAARSSDRSVETQQANIWQTAATGVWLFGAVACMLVVVVQHCKLARWVRRQPAWPADELLRECRHTMGLKREVQVVVARFPPTPVVFGIRSPRILVPTQLIDRLDGEQLRLIVLHELAHVRRNDVVQNWVLIILHCLHWFNPAIWFAFRQLRAERELVCDRTVLRCLAGETRMIYGATLLKVAELSVPSRSVPTLVPILNHKKQIERRIRMIPKFKPVSRLGALASSLLVVMVGCVLLTAADPKPAPSNAEPKAIEPSHDRSEESRAILREELKKLDALLRQKWREVDTLREELGISALEESDDRAEADVLGRLEALRVEGVAEHDQLNSLYRALTNLSRAELRRSLPTAAPDQLLMGLLQQQAKIEQEHSQAVETYGAEHPEVRRARRGLEQVTQQIDDRLDGILEGMKVRADSLQIRAQHLQRELEKTRANQINRATSRRPYLRAKRELENLEAVRDQLHQRLLQAQIDAALSHYEAK